MSDNLPPGRCEICGEELEEFGDRHDICERCNSVAYDEDSYQGSGY